ncbi:MAG TPA: hypothetical protein VHN77_11950, partial [Phycisphaerales bacterium]|nr:hypothetical protein [Phycisphaerales bacterium]
MKQDSAYRDGKVRAGALGVLAVVFAGLAVGVFSPNAAAQESRRRRRSDAAEAKPIELSPDQVAQLTKVANDRKLNIDDLIAASKTYMPSGRHDDYVLFSSGGQSGQVFAIGVPSMRLLRSIAVFTPESWQGYGFGGEHDKVLESMKIN